MEIKLKDVLVKNSNQYKILQVKEGYVLVENTTTKERKQFQLSWLQKMNEEGNLTINEDETFSFKQVNRKIEWAV